MHLSTNFLRMQRVPTLNKPSVNKQLLAQAKPLLPHNAVEQVFNLSNLSTIPTRQSARAAYNQSDSQNQCAVGTPKLCDDIRVASNKTASTRCSQLRVAYLGVPGAYGEAAARRAYPNAAAAAILCDQFHEAFRAVELGSADRAVLPIENSLGGSIPQNYDLLLKHHLHIIGEVQLPVHHCLLALPGVKKENLTRIISHPQALAQCETTLTKLLGLSVVRENTGHTAGAAQFIAANNLHDTAAVASARSAELYGLQILADGIQDDSKNVTRFMILAREPDVAPKDHGPFKTSIVFGHEEGMYVLFKVLATFASRNINLLKIESRPERNDPIKLVSDQSVGKIMYFQYLFYVDFEGSMTEVRAQSAVAAVQELTSFFRILGSYPMDVVTPCISFH